VATPVAYTLFDDVGALLARLRTRGLARRAARTPGLARPVLAGGSNGHSAEPGDGAPPAS
jgi:hypothetical protein